MRIKNTLGLLSGLLFLSLFSSTSFAQNSSANFSPAQKQEIESIIHEYLVKNPEVLVEVAQSLQKEQQDKFQKQAQKTVPEIATKLFDDKISPVAANPKGNVTLVEFFDYQCPHCKDMWPFIEDILKKDKNIRVIYKVLPIFGEDSKYDVLAALAAYAQSPEKFAVFHNAMMRLQAPLTPDVVLKLATQSGLNIKQLQADMKKADYEKEINQNYDLAKKLNLTGTPAFIMARVVYDAKAEKMLSFKNPVLVPGAVDEAMLAKAVSEARGG